MSADFETMIHADLKDYWRKAIGRKPPASTSSKFLRRALAYERQLMTSLTTDTFGDYLLLALSDM